MPSFQPRRVAASLILAVASAVATPARAAFVLEFDRANYDVEANSTVVVSVFLRETTTNLLTTQGLIAADIRLLFNESPRAAQPAQVIGRQLNPAFDGPAPVQPPIVLAGSTSTGRADIIQSSFLPVVPPASDPGRILIGRYVFQVGPDVGQVTRLRAADLDPSAEGFVLANGTAIDAQVQGGVATITVGADAAIPEPASLTLVATALPMGIGLARRWRRRDAGRRSRVG